MIQRIKPDPGLIPIVVGVTGHRDIPGEDLPSLSIAVDEQLMEIGVLYPSSPLVLASGLAEGADRLVARCALRLGWSVVAVLALPGQEFEKEFASPQSVADFRQLLSECWMHVTAPEACRTKPECYVWVGDWITRQSQLLIALWDNVHIEKLGGTSYVVRNFLKGPSIKTLEVPDSGPVRCIYTRRVSSTSPTEDRLVGEAICLWPDSVKISAANLDEKNKKEKERWEFVFSRIDEFNRLARIAQQQSPAKLAKRMLEKHKPGKTVLVSTMSEAAIRTNTLYAVADFLSEVNQGRREKWFKWMMVMSLIGFFFEAMYSGPIGDRVSLLAIGLACVVLAALPSGLRFVSTRWLNVSWLRQVLALEAHYLDFRALAEACRVQYYWQLAGVTGCVADRHLLNQRDELEWIRQAARSTQLTTDLLPARPSVESIQIAKKNWIEDQRNWLVGKELRQRTAARKGELIALGFLMVSLTIVLFTVVLQTKLGRSNEFIQWLQVVYGMALAFAAATSVYQRTMGYAEQARNYRRLALNMSLACEGVENCLKDNNIDRAADLVRQAGHAALDENSDWLLLHRDRPIGPPVG